MASFQEMYGRTVKIKTGMQEFVGKIGRIVDVEGKMFRIRFDEPVAVKGLGPVLDDIWERSGFKLLRD